MREQVCIVLNEREPLKAKTAEALANRLAELNITASRLEIDSDIEELILERLPKILILDYLLGDYSTGLDVLASLSEIADDKRPKTLFLTDEPSVSVAVDALRSGALNYFQIDNPQSIALLAREVRDILKADVERPLRKSQPTAGLSDLVAHSAKSQELIKQAQILATKKIPVTVIYGPRGTGISTLARAYAKDRRSESICKVVDLAYCDQTAEQVSGANEIPGEGLRLGDNLSLIIENAEQDDGSLLDFISRHLNEFWRADLKAESDSFLCICTQQEDTMRAWQSLAQAEVLRLMPLSDRPDDVPALAQRFVLEADQLADQKVKAFPSEIVSMIGEMDWPGNLKQLHTVVINTAIASTFGDCDLEQEIIRQREHWTELEQTTHDEQTPDPFIAAAALEAAGHSYRIAAARLGCSIQAVKSSIQTGLQSSD